MAVRSAHQFRELLEAPRRVRAWIDEHGTLAWWLGVLRLGLFQLGMGISLAPITGTLNRVLISDLRIPAVVVGFLMAIHYFVSPVRAIFGYKSDTYRAEGRWRTPYVVLGAMLTYGGLALAPFSLILLGGEGGVPFWAALAICSGIFLSYGVGVNIVETTYLALVSDITPQKDRGKVLAVLWLMLVIGTVVSSVVLGMVLQTYSHLMLIRVMQGSAVIFVVLTAAALLGKERMRPDGTLISYDYQPKVRMPLGEQVRTLWSKPALRGLFGVLFIGTLALATHDVLLEPYGGQVLGMSVAATTQLTALWGVAMIGAIVAAGTLLFRGRSATPLIVAGMAVGALGFAVVTLAGAPGLDMVFRLGVMLIGVGRGLFIVGSIALIMSLADADHVGLFVGMWGVMQALAQGVGTIGGGLTRDIAQQQTGSVLLGYTTVYIAALALLALGVVLFMALRLGRLIQSGAARSPWASLQDIPGDQILY